MNNSPNNPRFNQPNQAESDHSPANQWQNLGAEVPFQENRQNIPNQIEEDPENQTIFYGVKAEDLHNPDDTLEKLHQREQRENQIINAFIGGGYIENAPTEVSAEQRAQFYDWINNGTLNADSETSLLNTIPAPLTNSANNLNQATDLLQQLGSRHHRGILAYASGRGFGERDSVNTADLFTVFEHFPTPVEFDQVEQRMLQTLASSPQKVAEYTEDFLTFRDAFYGPRQSYHEAWQSLASRAEADQYTYRPDPNSHPAPDPEEVIFQLPGFADPAYQAPEMQAGNYVTIHDSEKSSKPKKSLFARFRKRKQK